MSHSNLRPKTSVHVLWHAPDTSEKECAYFRASVITSRKIWYGDDGPLTKKFCVKGLQSLSNSYASFTSEIGDSLNLDN